MNRERSPIRRPLNMTIEKPTRLQLNVTYVAEVGYLQTPDLPSAPFLSKILPQCGVNVVPDDLEQSTCRTRRKTGATAHRA